MSPNLKKSKPNCHVQWQPGYLLRPVAFRPWFTTGLALSCIKYNIFNCMWKDTFLSMAHLARR